MSSNPADKYLNFLTPSQLAVRELSVGMQICLSHTPANISYTSAVQIFLRALVTGGFG